MALCRMTSLLLGLTMASCAEWTPDVFPNPTTDFEACGRGKPSWICDPDKVLTEEGQDVVEGILKLVDLGDPPYVKISCGDAGPQGFEIGVAVMRKFEVTADEDDADAAETFAQALHAKWSVGRRECQNGILLLLAVDNRQLYISTGSGTRKLLTWAQLGNILNHAKPLLREGRYDQAVQETVVNIGLALANHEIDPTKGENDIGWFGGAVIAGVCSCFGMLMWQGVRDARTAANRYKSANTLIDKLRRDQAALQGGAYAVSSCPICLEDFTPEPTAPAAADGADADPPDLEADETTPLIGASASEVSPGRSAASSGASGDWEMVSRAAGASATGADVGSAAGSRGGASAGEGGAATVPVDGAPVEDPLVRRPMVVPCGHVFCEPCLARWVEEQKRISCPICRRNMDETDVRPSPRPPCEAPQQELQEQQAAWEETFPEAVVMATRVRPNLSQTYSWARPFNRWRQPVNMTPEQAQQMRQDMLRQDLMFRLMTLRRRYPEYITPRMANTWSQDMSAGREMSTSVLRDFQLANPAVRSQLQAQGAGGTSRGFGGGGGGGHSSGGRGGGW